MPLHLRCLSIRAAFRELIGIIFNIIGAYPVIIMIWRSRRPVIKTALRADTVFLPIIKDRSASPALCHRFVSSKHIHIPLSGMIMIQSITLLSKKRFLKTQISHFPAVTQYTAGHRWVSFWPPYWPDTARIPDRRTWKTPLPQPQRLRRGCN